MTKYIEIKDDNDNVKYIQKFDGWQIPVNEDNADYQAYLRWLDGEEENGTIS